MRFEPFWTIVSRNGSLREASIISTRGPSAGALVVLQPRRRSCTQSARCFGCLIIVMIVIIILTVVIIYIITYILGTDGVWA